MWMSEWRMRTECAHRTQLSTEGSCLLLTGPAYEGRLRPGTQLGTGTGGRPRSISGMNEPRKSKPRSPSSAGF